MQYTITILRSNRPFFLVSGAQAHALVQINLFSSTYSKTKLLILVSAHKHPHVEINKG